MLCFGRGVLTVSFSGFPSPSRGVGDRPLFRDDAGERTGLAVGSASFLGFFLSPSFSVTGRAAGGGCGGCRSLAREASGALETKLIDILDDPPAFSSTFLANSFRRMAPVQRQRMAATIKTKAVN